MSTSTSVSLSIPSSRRSWWSVVVAAAVAVAALGWLEPRAARAAPPSIAAATADVGDDDPPAHKATSGRLNLNTATAEQLEMLPGVGPAKAERIVAFRGKHGPFKRVADLRRVKGFGRKTLKKLERFLDIKGPTTLAADAE
ncbi:MAG: helix-hairpin-helix domain-containing protein [Myxococcales bacterium]|nr:helix-hairpin-helix domain-containing protein [Myxococcales bacterium]